MAGSVTFNLIDHSGETSTVSFNTPDLDDTNINGYLNTTIGQPLGDLKAAIDALTLMNEAKITINASQIVSPASLPADPNAQREQGLQVKYTDTVTGKKYRFTVPGLNRTLVAQQGTDVVDFENNVLMQALVAAFEADYTSEFGNPVTVYAASMIGRNN